VLTAVGWTPKRLQESVERVRELLRLERRDLLASPAFPGGTSEAKAPLA
jgi:hypothetical protein